MNTTGAHLGHITECYLMFQHVTLTMCVALWLLMLGSMSTVLALVLRAPVLGALVLGALELGALVLGALVLGALELGALLLGALLMAAVFEDGVLGPCCSNVSSTDKEHCRRFFLSW